MNHVAMATVFSLGLFLQGVAYVAKTPPEVSLAAAQPHLVHGAPVLLAAVTAPSFIPPGVSPYRQAGAVSVVTSPFFGAGSMVFFGS
jgi:hypothetical protein